MSTLRSMSRLCLLGMRQTSKLNSVVNPLARTMPRLSAMHNRGMASKGNYTIFLLFLFFLFCIFPIVDSEIDEFLKEEIKAEQQNARQLRDVSGFTVKKEGAELTFTKHNGSEK